MRTVGGVLRILVEFLVLWGSSAFAVLVLDRILRGVTLDPSSFAPLPTLPAALVVALLRRDRFVREGYRQHSMEISYSRFERVLRLPSSADHCSLRTEFADGMLLVILDEEG